MLANSRPLLTLAGRRERWPRLLGCVAFPGDVTLVADRLRRRLGRTGKARGGTKRAIGVGATVKDVAHQNSERRNRLRGWDRLAATRRA